MDEIIQYEQSYTLVFASRDQTRYACPLPDIASRDEGLLKLWLFNKSPKTVEAYTRDLERFYKAVKKTLPHVTLADLQMFSATLADLQPASQVRTMATIKSVLSFGARMEMLPTNVGAMFELPKLEDKLAERIMSEDSIETIINLEKDKRNHAMLVLLYYGGLRVSELCNLTWRNLQERDGSGQISVYGKGNKTRYVLLDTETWQEVWALRGNAPLTQYVFSSRQSHSRQGKDNQRLDESRVHQIVRRAADRAGIAVGKVSPHWFRHAHATHSLEAGASINLVKETLGHTSIETTAKYTHVRPNASSGIVLRKSKRKAQS